jgi:hypothetical protein
MTIADTTSSKDDLAGIPIAPLNAVIHDALNGMAKRGNMPGQPVTIVEMYLAIKERIQRLNAELLDAKNRDDVAAVQAKLALMQGEQSKIETGAQKVGVEGLLQGIYTCVGQLDGRRVVVPMRDWSGVIDWKEETLRSGDRTYRHLRTIVASKLTPEQEAMVRRQRTGEPEPPTAANDSTKPVSSPSPEEPPRSGAPGRPTSMHLVDAEFERRVKAGIVAPSLNKEAETLAAWLKKNHPTMPAAKASSIRNYLREIYRKAMNRSE